MNELQFEKITTQLEQIITLLKFGFQPASKIRSIFELIALGVTVAGIIGFIDILKNWIGG